MQEATNDATTAEEPNDDHDTPSERGETAPSRNPTDAPMVTPYEVRGEVDYDRLVERFGAEPLSPADRERFPGDHTALRRGSYFAGRDVERFLDAIERGEQVSVVTGIGPSGPMHLGHAVPFHLARHLQREAGAHVIIPVSDDEKRYAKELTFDEIAEHTRENLRDVLAFGFDPDRTRIVIDTADAAVVYPTAARIASAITPATVEAVYGEPPNVGLGFYPAVQATHLLLPQLLDGRHPTLVPVAIDQDPHVRVCRDVAGKERFDVRKPGDLLARFMPALSSPGGKMSASDGGGIALSDDTETIRARLADAYSGGRSSIEAHREHGGDPDVDAAFQLLRHFFEPDDDRLADLAERYRRGELLSGELKTHAPDAIVEFVETHREQRPEGDIERVVEPYRLTDAERERLAAAPLAS